MGRNLLLMSNSTVKHFAKTPKEGWLGAYKKEFAEFVEKSGTNKVLFVPYARPDGRSEKQYTLDIHDALGSINMGHLKITGLNEIENESEMQDAVQDNDYLKLIGGGNTWHLLAMLQRKGLVQHFLRAIEEGSYMAGISAGTNIFGYDIATTNDKYVTHLETTKGFNSVNNISINPHYEHGDWYIKNEGEQVRVHSGETMRGRNSEQGILEDLGMDKIMGLCVGSAIELHDDKMELIGGRPIYMFRKGINDGKPEIIHQKDISFLLKTA